MNVVREIERINENEFKLGIFGGMKGSWHDTYKESAWVFIGGMSYELTEGDIICVMSQWGEIEDINLVRDKTTNKSLGYAFVKFEDQRSTILAVDNFNGMKLLGRSLRCDHVEEYRLPKEVQEKEKKRLEENPDAAVSIGAGHVYKSKELANEFNISKGLDLWAAPDSSNKNQRDADSTDSSSDDDGDNDGKQPENADGGSGSGRRKKHRLNHDGDEKGKTKKDKKRSKKDGKKSKKEKREKKKEFDIDIDDRHAPVALVAPASRPRDSDDEIVKLLSAPNSSIMGSDGAQSWRGRRDPTVRANPYPHPASNSYGPSSFSGSNPALHVGNSNNRGLGSSRELSGIAGMNRVR